MLTKEAENEIFLSNLPDIFTISTDALHTRVSELSKFTEETSATSFPVTNLTSSDIGEKYFTEKVFGVVVAVITVYLTAVTVYYQIRFGKGQLIIVNSICTLAVCALLLRIVAVHVLLYGGHISDDLCNAAMCTSYICFGLNRFLPYVVLWLRQRNLYKASSQLDRNLKARPIKIISGITLAGIVLSQPALTTLQIIFTRFRSSPFGCVLQNKDSFFGFLKKVSPTIFGVAAAFQLVLLGLVLYPLILQIRKKKFNQAKMKKTIVRLAVCTTVCILSDLTFLLAKHLKPPGDSSILTALFSCCDNTINVMAVLASFGDYGLRFVPIHCCKSTPFQQIRSGRTTITRNSERRSGSSIRKE